jgi:hypothetical protein
LSQVNNGAQIGSAEEGVATIAAAARGTGRACLDRRDEHAQPPARAEWNSGIGFGRLHLPRLDRVRQSPANNGVARGAFSLRAGAAKSDRDFDGSIRLHRRPNVAGPIQLVAGFDGSWRGLL